MSVGQQFLEACVRQACLVEVRSQKPGNVSPGHAFEDASSDDFERSAAVISPILARTSQQGVGPTILKAVRSTLEAVGHNTNLGIVLLLTPLANVPRQQTLREGIGDVLRNLTVDDSRAVYEAIRIAEPAGMGTTKDQDVSQAPTVGLVECMRLARDRDLIAAQYATNFSDVLNNGLDQLRETGHWKSHRQHRVAWVALKLMSQHGDSLIRRKCGAKIEQQVADQAENVLQTQWPFTMEGQKSFTSFDEFLRADGHRRNPGTTADMIAAILFAALRDGVCTTNDTETQLIFPEDRHV